MKKKTFVEVMKEPPVTYEIYANMIDDGNRYFTHQFNRLILSKGCVPKDCCSEDQHHYLKVKWSFIRKFIQVASDDRPYSVLCMKYHTNWLTQTVMAWKNNTNTHVMWRKTNKIDFWAGQHYSSTQHK